MASPSEGQFGPFRMDSPWRFAVFLAPSPILFAAYVVFMLASGILAFPAGLAWFIYIAAHEELDFFSFPMVLQSVIEDVAIFVGLKRQLIFTSTDRADSGYCHASAPTKILNPRRESFIFDFDGFEKDTLNSSNPRKPHHLSYPRAQATASRTIDINQTGDYSILSAGVNSPSGSSSVYQSTSPSYRSAASVLSVKGFLRTPDQRLPDFSRRIISPHWSVGRPINKSGTPSPLELSPGELEYPDSYMPSPKRWPSPVSDLGGSLRIRPKKTTFSEYMEANERVFFTDDVGNTHLYKMDTSSHANINNVQSIDYLSQDHSLQSAPLKLERKLFEDKKSVNVDKLPPEDYLNGNMKIHNLSSTECNNETALTVGWSHRYKNLIVELKGSLGKQDEDDDQAKKGFNPITDIDPHWMDVPRLSPLERPRLNKLQRWGLIHTHSKANLKDGVREERSRQNLISKSSEFPFFEAPSTNLKEGYNFGNLELSPDRRGDRSDSDDEEYSKSYWEGFDEAYSVRESKYPRGDSDEEEKWKLSMGKWAEKGVEVMRPVNEEGRENPERISRMPIPLGSTKEVHWLPPLPDSDEREPFLYQESFAIDDENFDGSCRLKHIRDRTPRTPSPALLLGEKVDLHEKNKKESIPLGETSNRLFGRRIARASRLPAASSPTLTTPPRPLPEKLIRMFEDLSKPQPTSPRPSSINSSPERVNCSPGRNNPSTGRNEGSHGSEIRGLGLDLGDASHTIPPREIKRNSMFGLKGNDDGLNECF